MILQVASSINCKECIGIEKAEIPSGYAQVSYIYINQITFSSINDDRIHCQEITVISV